MKGTKARETRANMHVHGVKEAKPSFVMVVSPFRVERERKKLREIHPKLPYLASLCIEHCKGTKRGRFLLEMKESKGTKLWQTCMYLAQEELIHHH